jgi:hypothetical protein
MFGAYRNLKNRTVRFLLSICCLSFLVLGCGKGTGADSLPKVTGTVTMNGAPLPGGSIDFLYSDPSIKPATSLITETGQYTIFDATPGDVKVVVKGPGKSSDLKKKNDPVVKVPDRYHDGTKSGLSYTVIKGDQKKDFELTSP